jgi:hypothetical protein
VQIFCPRISFSKPTDEMPGRLAFRKPQFAGFEPRSPLRTPARPDHQIPRSPAALPVGRISRPGRSWSCSITQAGVAIDVPYVAVERSPLEISEAVAVVVRNCVVELLLAPPRLCMHVAFLQAGLERDQSRQGRRLAPACRAHRTARGSRSRRRRPPGPALQAFVESAQRFRHRSGGRWSGARRGQS